VRPSGESAIACPSVQEDTLNTRVHDEHVDSEEAALVVLRGLAAGSQRLESAADDETVRFHHLTVRETAQGLWVAAALVLRRSDGRELERTLSARHALEGRGWTVEREVLLNESPIGEPEVRASQGLPAVQFATTAELAIELPRLIDELLDAPTPQPVGP
jgi:hypothetical protein